MPNEHSEKTPVPDSLLVALEERHVPAVLDWWNGLTESQQREFVVDARNEPDGIATQTNIESSAEEDDPNEWYEYVVNQEMRFYFDRSRPYSSYNIVEPILAPISAAADIKIVSHLLTVGENPDRNRC
ncbi:MAG: hypothetical protein HUJ26_11575 [Planctomycetaceae bacterium]|nr:hypothetical protein [Planctomycetaceae bacterium]